MAQAPLGRLLHADDQISPGGRGKGEDRAVRIGRTSQQYRIALNCYLDAGSPFAPTAFAPLQNVVQTCWQDVLPPRDRNSSSATAHGRHTEFGAVNSNW